MAIGLRRISEKVGLSVGTVSHILSGRDDLKYAQKTRDIVWAVARELGYEPNCVARGLQSGKTRIIGVVVHGVGNNHVRITMAEQLANKWGYQVLLSISRWETQGESDDIRRLLRQKVDGLLIITPAVDAVRNPILESLVRDRFPLVCIGQSTTPGVDFVDWDRVGAYEQMTHRLLDQGCRKFIFLGNDNTPSCSERIRGIHRALMGVSGTELKLLNCLKQPDPPEYVCAEKILAESLSSHWPEAVICHTDLLALETMKTARAAGYKLPDELAITGCSNFPYSGLLEVPLTTIQMPDEDLMVTAMDVLMKKIENPNAFPVPIAKIIPAQVILRESIQFHQKKKANRSEVD